ncbi:MAG: M23 family metallopeptidase [Bacteroidaceae bacterium]|nr:M23 family metallopeptidase [Bacteroidaceae bacterium]
MMKKKKKKIKKKKKGWSGWKTIMVLIAIVLFAFWVVPERRIPNPVDGCGPDSYNHQSFWYPWGDHFHRGIDIFAAHGTPVRSVTDGFVVKLYTADKGWPSGNAVEILGRSTRAYYYAHLSEIDSELYLGKYVRKGQIIGKVGKTGNADRANVPCHCHFSIHTWIPQFQNGFVKPKYHRWDLVEKLFYVNPIIAMGDSVN